MPADPATVEPFVYDQALHDLYVETGIEPTWVVDPATVGLGTAQVHEAMRDGSILDWSALPDGRVLVADAALNLIGVTPGLIDPAATWVYLRGQCLALAVALAIETGWPLRTVQRETDTEPWEFKHVVVESPTGDWLDIRGRFEPTTDPGMRIPAQFAATVLDAASGTSMPPQHLGLAATFVPTLLG